jgi:hypothetical protein
MTKRITTYALAAAIGVLLPVTVLANTVAGRVTSFTPASISVFGKEVVTVGMNADTTFTRWVVAKPWQADTALTFGALAVGRYVIVHADRGMANWVQIAMDRPSYEEPGFTAIEPRAVVPPAFGSEAARHRAEAAALRASPNASETKRPGAPGTAVHCDRLADELEKAGK